MNKTIFHSIIVCALLVNIASYASNSINNQTELITQFYVDPDNDGTIDEEDYREDSFLKVDPDDDGTIDPGDDDEYEVDDCSIDKETTEEY